MKYSVHILTFLIITLACESKSEEGFNLKRDINNFSDRMTITDTLIVFVDLSACTSFRYDRITFTKSNDKVWMKTIAKGDYIDEKEGKLPRIKYQIDANDNFESLFKYMGESKEQDPMIGSISFLVIHKKDTLKYLYQRDSSSRYNKMMSRMYSEAEFYKPLRPPTPPDNLE